MFESLAQCIISYNVWIVNMPEIMSDKFQTCYEMTKHVQQPWTLSDRVPENISHTLAMSFCARHWQTMFGNITKCRQCQKTQDNVKQFLTKSVNATQFLIMLGKMSDNVRKWNAGLENMRQFETMSNNFGQDQIMSDNVKNHQTTPDYIRNFCTTLDNCIKYQTDVGQCQKPSENASTPQNT